MELMSTAFADGDAIPSRYTCDGENINPPLTFSSIPEDVQSLVLIMEDPDVPKSIRPDGMWDHWVVFNIPPETTGVAEGETLAGRLGKNTRGTLTYGGPCPPDREHRYFFKLFALNALLDLPEGASKADVLKELNEENVLAEATLMGRYERQKEGQ